jgi:tetratricopeptide (TPR) repeat protein
MQNYSRVIASYYKLICQVDKAKDILYSALKIAPDDYGILDDLQSILHFQRKQDVFIDILKEIETMRPLDYRLKWNIGTQIMMRSRHKDALPYLLYCVENRSPGMNDYAAANAMARLGICYAMLGDFLSSETMLLKCQSIAPWDIDMCYGLILLYKVTGRHDKIPVFLDKKMAEFPDFYPLYYWKGDYVSSYQNNERLVVEWYKKALKFLRTSHHYKDFSQWYFSSTLKAYPENIFGDYSYLLLKLGKKWELLWDGLIFKLFFWNAVNLHSLQIIYLSLIDQNLAEKKCHALIARKNEPGRTAQILSLLSESQTELGKLDESIENARKAISVDKNNLGGWDILGQALMLKNDWREAIKIFEHLVEIDPYCSDWLIDLGKCYLEVGEIESSELFLRKSADLNPSLDSTA